jgi:hypothetical protein
MFSGFSVHSSAVQIVDNIRGFIVVLESINTDELSMRSVKADFVPIGVVVGV